MAYIRKRTTGKLDKFGNPIATYAVCWREPVRDDFGAIVPGKTVQRTETLQTEKKAKARMRQVENALDSARGIDPSSQKAKANTPLGTYARQYLDSLAGTVDPTTIQGYEKLYRTHIGPVFGSEPVAAITTADVARFRAALLKPYERNFVTRGKPRAGERQAPALRHRSPKTVKHIIGTLKRILDTALDDQAVPANPIQPGRRHSTKRRANAVGETRFKHRPLTSNEVAALHGWIASERHNAIYALAVLFSAYTRVRAAELQGLQVQDITLSDIPGTAGAIHVRRTAARRQGEWTSGTPKTAQSERVVPLAPWLADDLRDYLTMVHPFAGKYPHAPLFPGKRTRAGSSPVAVEDFDWAKSVVVDNVYHNYFQPACEAMGLGRVRWHDLRHTFATLALSAGEHYMQVSKWLGHSSYVLTLSTYADYITEDETRAPALARPTVAVAASNVTALEPAKARSLERKTATQ